MSSFAPGVHGMVWLIVALAALFLGTGGLVMWSRHRFARHARIVQAVYDIGAEPSVDEEDASTRARAATMLLERAPASLLWTLASDARAPGDLQRLVAAGLVAQQGPERLIRRAANGTSWKRVAALRALTLTRHPAATDLLARAFQESSEDVGRATVSLLGQMDDARSAELLAHVLHSGQQPRSRVGTALDEFPRPVPHLVTPLLWSDDAQVRFWACALMRRYPETPGLLERLVTLAADDVALVRKAAIDTLASLGDERGIPAVVPALDDEVSFVRAHATRALGTLGGVVAAPAIAEQLADDDWWVRSAAKQTLERLGPEVAEAVIPMLAHADRFARNGAAEVLQNTGVYARILTEEAQSPGDPLRQQVLTRLVAAGGRPMWNGHIIRVPRPIRVRARALEPPVPTSQE